MQFDQLKRREFITLHGHVAARLSAQQPMMPMIGSLSSSTPFASSTRQSICAPARHRTLEKGGT
jgi:hypothetical protein